MTNQLIKQAISESYTEQQWLLIMLRQPWHQEGYGHVERESLQLNQYTRIEITSYYSFKPTTIHNVAVLLKSSTSLRPRTISCVIDCNQDYKTHIVKEITNLLEKARCELYALNRGRELTL